MLRRAAVQWRQGRLASLMVRGLQNSECGHSLTRLLFSVLGLAPKKVGRRVTRQRRAQSPLDGPSTMAQCTRYSVRNDPRAASSCISALGRIRASTPLVTQQGPRALFEEAAMHPSHKPSSVRSRVRLAHVLTLGIALSFGPRPAVCEEAPSSLKTAELIIS